MEFGPDAWGWFFAPFANLFKPYQAIRELWFRASDWAQRPDVLPVWWGVWLISGLTGHASLRMLVRMMRDDVEISEVINATCISVVDTFMTVLRTVLTLLVVRTIDAAVDDHPRRFVPCVTARPN